jgi:hypothetical protein
MYDERPFLRPFAEHYLDRLQFDKLYLINSRGTLDYITRELPNRHLRKTVLLNWNNNAPDWQLDAVRFGISHVEEEWVLSVDLDEFLDLGGMVIDEFTAPLTAATESVRLYWKLFLLTDCVPGPQSHFHVADSKTFKTMARTAKIAKVGLHDLSTVTPKSVYALPHEIGHLKHFAARGLYDLIGRIVDRNYEDAKSGQEEAARVRRLLNSNRVTARDLPFRVNLLRIQLSMAASTIQHDPLGLVVCDGDMLRRIFAQKLKLLDVELPVSLDRLDRFMEDELALKRRLLCSRPPLEFAHVHIAKGGSLQRATHEYLASPASMETF